MSRFSQSYHDLEAGSATQSLFWLEMVSCGLTMCHQLPVETDKVPWSHVSADRSFHNISLVDASMSPPGAGELVIIVAQFLRKASHLEREASALRQSGSPRHLQQIKTLTQDLSLQAVALTNHLDDDSPENKHLLTLIRDCQRSSFCLLTYLHTFVASTRATIVPNSRKPIHADLKWTPIRNLINTARVLCVSMEAAGLVKRCEDKGPVHLRLSPDPLRSPEARVIVERAQNESQMHDELPNIGSRKRSLGNPAWSSRDAFSLPDSHASYQRCQPSPHGRRDTVERDLDQRSLPRTIDTVQVLSTCLEWEKIFNRHPLPALVLYYATKLCERSLSAPDTQLDEGSGFQSLLRLDRILQSSCYKLLDICGPEGLHIPHLHSSGRSFDCDLAIVVSPNGASFETLRSKEISDLIDCRGESWSSDPLCRLASACLTVLRTRDSFHSPLFQRCLLYLAHILRQDSVPAETTEQYLTAIADAMANPKVRHTNKSIPWSTLPQPTGSLHLKPELQCYADILTFAAREALPLPPHMLTTCAESRHRFAITAHALASWSSGLPDTHPDKSLQPGLQKRQTMLRYLLTHLTPPESTVCYGEYSLCKEALRLCNSGHVEHPLLLLAIFLAKSERPDLLWNQALRPSVKMGWNACELLTALEGEIPGATAPRLFQSVVCQVGQMSVLTGEQSGPRKQESGGVAEWKGW